MTITVIMSNATPEHLARNMADAKVSGYAARAVGTSPKWGVEPNATFTTAVKTKAEAEHVVAVADDAARSIGEQYIVLTVAGPTVGTVTLMHKVGGPKGSDELLG